MIHGAHVIIYSKDAEADRAFFRDVLTYESVDAGHGWLIFALPPSEVAVHPSDENNAHELFLMCDDVHAFIAEMKKQKVKCSPVDEQRWGSILPPRFVRPPNDTAVQRRPHEGARCNGRLGSGVIGSN